MLAGVSRAGATDAHIPNIDASADCSQIQDRMEIPLKIGGREPGSVFDKNHRPFVNFFELRVQFPCRINVIALASHHCSVVVEH